MCRVLTGINSHTLPACYARHLISWVEAKSAGKSLCRNRKPKVGTELTDMVVLSAAISTKNGKTLLSRQFVEMTRIRIEGLLAAFPKLLGSDTKQHTYVETESVRYLYQPLDNLYLLLITNRASNIVEDLETLRLLSKVVPDVAGAANNISEEKITEKCFDLIFAFDEVSGRAFILA